MPQGKKGRSVCHQCHGKDSLTLPSLGDCDSAAGFGEDMVVLIAFLPEIVLL